MYGFRFTVYGLDFARSAKPPVRICTRVARTGQGQGVGQDHVRIILLQNWAVALDANVQCMVFSSARSSFSRIRNKFHSF